MVVFRGFTVILCIVRYIIKKGCQSGELTAGGKVKMKVEENLYANGSPCFASDDAIWYETFAFLILNNSGSGVLAKYSIL